jgi:chemotaxis family two-component system response regulator Rcp1
MSQKIILHIEDDPSLASLVKFAFESFGFKGEMLHATLVEEAFTLLADRARKKLPVDLILSDMNLPDGKGLDLIHRIKASPTWQKTPVIILSGESSPDIISESYALGANCYLRKLPRKGRGLEHFRSLYKFWIESALLPETSFEGGIQEVFRKATQLRTRTAKIYIELSKEADTASEQESCWLERAMGEGSLSSLMLFLHDLISDNDVPLELTERLSKMQRKVEMALVGAEQANMNRYHAEKIDISHSILGLLEAYDEEAFSQLFGVIFPMNQTVSETLRSRGAKQLREISNYVFTESHDSELVKRAKSLQEFSGRLGRMSVEAQSV